MKEKSRDKNSVGSKSLELTQEGKESKSQKARRANPRKAAEHQAWKDTSVCLLGRSANSKTQQPETHRAGLLLFHR